MAFINRLLLVLLLVLLAACATTPGEDKKKPAKPEQEVVTTPEAGGDTAAPLELIPNPYLAQKPSVPGKAKQEFAKALAAMNAKQWKQAEGLLGLLTETWPDLSGPWVNLGIAQEQLQEFDAAELSYQKAIEVNPANDDAYEQLGVFYRERGRFQEAEKTYLAALEVWPHNPEAHRNLGILYDLYMGKFAEALQHYKLLAQILPEEDRQLQGWILDLERRLPASEEASE